MISKKYIDEMYWKNISKRGVPEMAFLVCPNQYIVLKKKKETMYQNKLTAITITEAKKI